MECLCGLGRREEGGEEGREWKESRGNGRDLNDLLCCHTILINPTSHYTRGT